VVGQLPDGTTYKVRDSEKDAKGLYGADKYDYAPISELSPLWELTTFRLEQHTKPSDAIALMKEHNNGWERTLRKQANAHTNFKLCSGTNNKQACGRYLTANWFETENSRRCLQCVNETVEETLTCRYCDKRKPLSNMPVRLREYRNVGGHCCEMRECQRRLRTFLAEMRNTTDAWNNAITAQEALENFNAASNYAGKPTLTNLQVEWDKARKALLVELRTQSE
jgi:glutamate/tyrosine decarboxylase-like PLP-dependent enzyme